MIRLLFALLFLSSCVTSNVRERVTYYDGKNQPSQSVELHDGKQTGVMETWYENGKQKVTCEQAAQNSLLCRHFYPTGQLLREFSKINSELHGTYQEFYQHGQQRISGTFIEGKRHGIWQFFAPSGESLSIIHYYRGIISSQIPEATPPCPLLTNEEIETHRNLRFQLPVDWCK